MTAFGGFASTSVIAEAGTAPASNAIEATRARRAHRFVKFIQCSCDHMSTTGGTMHRRQPSVS